jgi:hypothetical protein
VIIRCVEIITVCVKYPGRVEHRSVRRLITLGALSSRIVEAIVEGRQPPNLTVMSLTRRIDLPLLWSAQEEALIPRLSTPGARADFHGGDCLCRRPTILTCRSYRAAYSPSGGGGVAMIFRRVQPAMRNRTNEDGPRSVSVVTPGKASRRGAQPGDAERCSPASSAPSLAASVGRRSGAGKA